MLKINKVLTVAKFTFKELIKGKFLLLSFLGFLAITLVTFISAEFSYGDPARVALDVGLGILSITSVLIAAIVGQGIIYDEIEARTIYMMITRPITRVEFLLGKILGLVLLVMVNIAVLSLATFLMISIFGGSIQSILFLAILFLFLESLIVILWSLTASLLTSRLITGLATFVMYFAGHVIGEIKQASLVLSNHFFKYMIVMAESTLPMLYKINLKTYVQYPTQLPDGFILTGLAYALLYIFILISIAIYIFKRKELD